MSSLKINPQDRISNKANIQNVKQIGKNLFKDPKIDAEMGLDLSSDEEDKKPPEGAKGSSGITDPKNIIEINVIDPMNKKKEAF